MLQNEQIFSEKVKWKSNSRIKAISEFDLRTLPDNKLIVIIKFEEKPNKNEITLFQFHCLFLEAVA